MTERLSDVETRIGTVHQLSAVITAMRGVAAARSREARRSLDGVRGYAETIALAISQALTFLPEGERPDSVQRSVDHRRGGHAVIALCAEQGFAGVFSEHILVLARSIIGQTIGSRSVLMLVGDRGLMVAGERGLDIDWSAPMVAHIDQAAALANRIVEALYARLESGEVERVTLVHAVPGLSASLEIAQRKLIPFDLERFPASPGVVTPLITLPPQQLLTRLIEEYVFAELCEAIIQSFAAENEARMRAMIAAKANVAKTLDDLIARSRQLRQEAITNEIIELAGGAAASSGLGSR